MTTKLKELEPGGCFARAMPDEPMFVLLARDPSAATLVDKWADQREAEIKAGRRPSADLEQVADARDCATAMRQWRRANDGAWRNGLFAEADESTLDPYMQTR